VLQSDPIGQHANNMQTTCKLDAAVSRSVKIRQHTQNIGVWMRRYRAAMDNIHNFSLSFFYRGSNTSSTCATVPSLQASMPYKNAINKITK